MTFPTPDLFVIGQPGGFLNRGFVMDTIKSFCVKMVNSNLSTFIDWLLEYSLGRVQRENRLTIRMGLKETITIGT